MPTSCRPLSAVGLFRAPCLRLVTHSPHEYTYLAGHLTARSDVYSFGVLLLEAKIHHRPKLSYKRWLLQIIDPKLEVQYSVRGAHKACSLAYWCLSQNPKSRLLMSDVVEMLEPLQERGGSDGAVVHVGGLPDYRICRMLTGNSVHCRSIPSPKCPPVIPTCRVR